MAKQKSQKKKKKKSSPPPRSQRRSRANIVFVAIGVLIMLSVVLGPILPELLGP